MGPPTTLPTINLSPFLSPTSTPESRSVTATALNAACRDYGFFYLINHGIPASTTSQILSLARTFFALPTSEKATIARAKDGVRGYQGLGENVTLNMQDMHEAIDLYAEREAAREFPGLDGGNLWPAKPEELRGVYEQYVEQCGEVGRALVGAMGVALGLRTKNEDFLVRESDEHFWIMRMIGYPPLAKPAQSGEDIEAYSCGEHSDYGLVTLLLADETKGALQVRLRDGSYLNVDPVPGAFVVNIGDMIERWTNGLWHSVRHRVVHRGEGYRVSVPFFYEPNWNTVVRPLRECVERTGGVEMYEEVRYGDHLMGKMRGNFYGGDA